MRMIQKYVSPAPPAGTIDPTRPGTRTGDIVLWDARQRWCGLGDRIRGVASGLAVASELGCRLLVKWTPDGACNARFEDLFDCPEVSSFTRDLSVRDVERLSPRIAMTQRQNMMPSQAFELFSANPRTDVFGSRERFLGIWAEQLRRLRPVGSIREAIRDFVSTQFRERMTAIHLRRTDVLTDGSKGIRSENKSDFDDRMLAEIVAIHEQDADAGFLLASDDAEYFRTWEEKLRGMGVHVVVYKKEWGSSFRQTSVRDALIDLYLIGHCRLILGSVWSSFLFVAQHIQGAELRYLT